MPTPLDHCRLEPRKLDPIQKERIDRFKRLGNEFIEEVSTADHTGREMGMSSREYALAITKIEEAVMWAVKGVS